jgi:hypothetical protein
MSSPRSAGPSRRRQRSVRVTVAFGLLVVATLVVTSALVSGSERATAGASLLALVCGFAATRIVANELAQSRRDAARDRAAQAHAYQSIYAERIAEHNRFATSMTEQIIERDGQIGRLLATVRLVRRKADDAEDRAEREAARNAELQGLLDAASRALEEQADAVAFWDGTDVPAVTDLLAWEERVTAVTSDQADFRRPA